MTIEENDFLLKDLIKEYPLYQERYGEFGRLAVLPNFRKANIFPSLFYHLATLSKSFHCNYFFSIAPMSQILCKRTGKKIGLNIQIRKGINVPKQRIYKNIKGRILLLSCNFRDYTQKINVDKLENSGKYRWIICISFIKLSTWTLWFGKT